MKILVMGLPGSGKTYLAKRMQPILNAAWYNADIVREMANDWDFSPEGRIRQNFDGSFLLGGSNEDVGYNLDTTVEVMQQIADRAIKIFPILKDLRLIRSWAALRVLSPDLHPVYIESEKCPGAFAVTSHSGVSLASLHSSYLGEWILQGHHNDKLEVFHPSRFDVP